MNKIALITGVTGQDGSLLSELLLSKGYDVYGLSRMSSVNNTQRINHLLKNEKFKVLFGDINDISTIIRAINFSKCDEFYNFAGNSFVKESWDNPIITANSVGIGVLNCLESIKIVNKNIKFFQASSSEIFGNNQDESQTEETPLNPQSPYGIAKAFGHNITKTYRDNLDFFACNGIFYGHESGRRNSSFIIRKIVESTVKIKMGCLEKIILGNIDSKRDWGFANDYVLAAWMILQQGKPDDFIISSGEVHSIKEVLDICFNLIGIRNWEQYISIDANLFRPADKSILCGDNSKIKKIGWEATMKFENMIEHLVEEEIYRTRSLFS